MSPEGTSSKTASEPKVEIYEAATQDLKEHLYRLRYQIFTQEQHKYIESADHVHQRLKDELDDHAVHLCVSINGEMVGSMRQVRGAEHISAKLAKTLMLERFSRFDSSKFGFTGRLLILPKYRGSKALMPLLCGIYESARQFGITFDFINCNPHLVRLYELVGYRRYRNYYEDAELGFQIPMVIVGDDQDHFKRVRSPFSFIAPKYQNTTDNSEWFRATFPEYASFVAPSAMGFEDFGQFLSSKINSNDIPLFHDLTEAETKEFIDAATHFTIEPGTKLVRRGDMGKEMFVILNGVAEVRRSNPGNSNEVLLATLGRGSVFGEMSVLSSKPRSADVIAMTTLEVVFIDQIALKRYIKSKPEMATKLLYNLSVILADRLELASSRLSEELPHLTVAADLKPAPGTV